MTEIIRTARRNVELLKSFQRALTIGPTKTRLSGNLHRVYTSGDPLGIMINRSKEIIQGTWGFSRFIEAIKGKKYGELSLSIDDLIDAACSLFRISRIEAMMFILKEGDIATTLGALIDPYKTFGPNFDKVAKYWSGLEQQRALDKEIEAFKKGKIKHGLTELQRLNEKLVLEHPSTTMAYKLIRDVFKYIFGYRYNTYSNRAELLTGDDYSIISVQDKINLEHRSLSILTQTIT